MLRSWTHLITAPRPAVMTWADFVRRTSRAPVARGWLPATVAISVLLPPFLPPSWLRISGLALIYAILGIGLNIVSGYAGLLDLGYAAFFGVGSYFYAILASDQLGVHLPFWLLVPGCVGVACIAGAIVGAPALKMRGDYLALVTLAWGGIAYIFFVNLDHPINVTNGVNGIVGVDPAWIAGYALGDSIAIGPITIEGALPLFYLTLLSLGFVIWYATRLENSRLGRAWNAMRDDEVAAVSVGVKPLRTKLLAFILGASTAGLAGAVATLWQGSVYPDNFTLVQSITVLLIVVLGGMRIPGIIAAAAVITIVPQMFQGFALYRLIAFGILLIALMIARPRGFGATVRRTPRNSVPESSAAPPRQ